MDVSDFWYWLSPGYCHLSFCVNEIDCDRWKCVCVFPLCVSVCSQRHLSNHNTCHHSPFSSASSSLRPVIPPSRIGREWPLTHWWTLGCSSAFISSSLLSFNFPAYLNHHRTFPASVSSSRWAFVSSLFAMKPNHSVTVSNFQSFSS